LDTPHAAALISRARPGRRLLIAANLLFASSVAIFPANATEKSVGDLLPLLPTEAFENTTEGIEADELKELVGKGASANWTLRTVAPHKVVASARRPSGEVHLTRKDIDGADVIEALTFNQKAVSYGYWAAGAAGKPLTAHQPSGRARAFNETGDGAAIPPGDVPAPIRQYIDKMEQCQHWSGEAGDDAPPARQREIAGQLKKLGCASRPRDEKALQAKFAGQPRWLGLIARATRLLGE